MSYLPFVFMLVFSGVLMYEQNDYIMILEHVEIVSYNKQHVGFAKTRNFKYNRTHTGTNFTLKMLTAFGNNLQMEIQGYKFASNEYRLFPITFAVNICATIAKNDFGLQNLYSCGNFSRCPFKKGNFVICNWSPDYSKFPPFIPAGSYMMDYILTYFDQPVLQAQGYASVKRIKDFNP
ncbi:hypothetical protein ILUMI_08248 [Ignelater luminosus]|uniref:Uncharacterized protein n=1 Tax=Ignelater luminosus TaxID=2038154 RepID=A0A8K0GDK8_IGNLU|nr:hypothetical protein ILUMI_08248 [Ignelater luminosus]